MRGKEKDTDTETGEDKELATKVRDGIQEDKEGMLCNCFVFTCKGKYFETIYLFPLRAS